jgi:integrase/recombinase XerD
MSKKSTCTQDVCRHNEVPFATERERYLQYCADSGATAGSLQVKRNELIRIAQFLPENASQGVDITQLQEIARQFTSIQSGVTMPHRVIAVGRPWLRFLGWWRVAVTAYPFQSQLDSYVSWMRDERGFTPSTVLQWQGRIRQFLWWCATTDRPLSELRPNDVDAYFIQNASRWSRTSMKVVTGALRIFLRYAASNGLCDSRLATAVYSKGKMRVKL